MGVFVDSAGAVAASGPGLAAPITKTVMIGATNARLDFVLPAPGHWDSLPAGSSYLSAATGADGRIYVTGTPNTNPQFSAPFGGAAVFDPPSNQWTTLPDQPALANEVAAASADDWRIYAIGGLVAPPGSCSAYDTAIAAVSAFSPAADASQSVPDEPTLRAGAIAVTTSDGRMLVAGGHQINPTNGNQSARG